MEKCLLMWGNCMSLSGEFIRNMLQKKDSFRLCAHRCVFSVLCQQYRHCKTGDLGAITSKGQSEDFMRSINKNAESGLNVTLYLCSDLQTDCYKISGKNKYKTNFCTFVIAPWTE
jgi:hypothetical protein